MRITKRQKKVLSVIGKLSIVAAAFIMPNIIQLLRPENPEKKYRYKKIINKMFDDEIIYLSGEKIELTEKGKKLLRQIQVEDIQINSWQTRPAEWDGVWHLVCYDIPEPFKNKRDYFRRKLIESHFYQIQLSLWVCPYDCKEDIAVVAQNLGIAPFVAYLNTDHLPQQDKLVKLFDLHNSNTIL